MITVLGWYGHRNIGDESYRLTFQTLAPDQKFSFSEFPEEDDMIIVGGGDILHRSFLEKAVKFKGKKIILSTSANPNTPFSLLKEFSQIFVRDHYSVDLLQSHQIPSTFMPDFAYLLKPSKERGMELLYQLAIEEGIELYKKRIGVVFNAHLMQSGKNDMLARDFLTFQKNCNDLANIADTTSASFIFFPMCTNMPYDDRISNAIIATRCKYFKKNLLIQKRLSVQETLDLISCFDAVISSRLHSSIFSLISNVPFVDLVHHNKNKIFLDTVKLSPYGMSYWDLKRQDLHSLINDLIEKPSTHRVILSNSYEEQMTVLRREIPHVCLR